MPFRFGRPDINRYTDRFDVPRAENDFGVTFLGVSTLLLDDGESALLTDGFFSRPSPGRVLFRRIAPDVERITTGLTRAGAGVGRLAGVLPVHTHYDHAQDSAVVAARTGARLLGGRSAAQIGRGHGPPAEQIDIVASGDTRRFGRFEVTWLESTHCPPDRFPGPIAGPVVPPVRVKAYRCGEAWSILLAHDNGRTALIQGSAGFVPGALSGRHADVAYLGVGQLGRQDEAYLRSYWAQTVAGGRRAARRAHSLGRLLPSARQAAPRPAILRRRPGRDDAGSRHACHRTECGTSLSDPSAGGSLGGSRPARVNRRGGTGQPRHRRRSWRRVGPPAALDDYRRSRTSQPPRYSCTDQVQPAAAAPQDRRSASSIVRT